VLLSHLHRDHADLPSLRRLGRSTPLIAPRGAGVLLRRRGFQGVHELDEGESTTVGAVEVEAVPAEHDGRRHGFGAPAASAGYVIRGSRSVYFAGDTDLFAGMADLAGVDLALVPIAGWGPRLGPGHLDPLRAAEAVRLLRPRVAVPIHWGTYVPSYRSEPYPRDVTAEFAQAAAELAPDVEVRIVPPGERTTL
jgi:L-ascorbate metabolism protein UlaG (beta-lactamase superfamily)